MDIFGKEEWKPVVGHGTVIPGYYADKTGIVVGKTGKVLSKYSCPGIYGHRGKMQKLAFSTDESTFGDYNYRKPCKGKRSRSVHMTIAVHRIIMETWKPIDEYPPIPKKDWDKTPESAKQFIRDSAIVDHIDDDTHNNHIDNLQWVTPLENSSYRKKSKA